MTGTFADSLAVRLWGRTAAEARHDGICVRCGKPFIAAQHDELDQREYRITALCCWCWAAISPEEPTDEGRTAGYDHGAKP